MRKVFFIVLMGIISMSVYGITERSIYNASGEGVSNYMTIGDEQTMVYMFASIKSDSIRYRGAMVYVDNNLQPEGVIHFNWYTHRGNMVIEPYLMELYEDGEVVATQEGFGSTLRDPVSLIRHGGNTVLIIGNLNLLLMN